MKNNNGYYQTAEDLTNNQDTSLKKQLEQLVPEAFLDGVLDLNSLKKLLENNEINFDEKQNNLFGLYWNGKSKARVNAFNNLNTKTLIPVREKSLNFDSANNIVIEGDNLEVLKTLEASYHNQVDVIYIDPPYNTGNDFVYNDDFKESSMEYKLNNALIDEGGLKTTTNQKTHGRFHTKWLNMIYPRLILARKLLKDTGVIFISIDDNEQARLKLISDEIFGEENFVGNNFWQTNNSSMKYTKYFRNDFEYIKTYVKNKNTIFEFNKRKNASICFENPDNDPNGNWFSSNATYKFNKESKNTYEIKLPNGKSILRTWRFSKEEMEQKKYHCFLIKIMFQE